MDDNPTSKPAGHSDTESVADALSDFYVYIYRINNSTSILVTKNMSIGNKMDFLSQLLTRHIALREHRPSLQRLICLRSHF